MNKEKEMKKGICPKFHRVIITQSSDSDVTSIQLPRKGGKA
jgi:hypothetical protein